MSVDCIAIMYTSSLGRSIEFLVFNSLNWVNTSKSCKLRPLFNDVDQTGSPKENLFYFWHKKAVYIHVYFGRYIFIFLCFPHSFGKEFRCIVEIFLGILAGFTKTKENNISDFFRTILLSLVSMIAENSGTGWNRKPGNYSSHTLEHKAFRGGQAKVSPAMKHSLLKSNIRIILTWGSRTLGQKG